MRLRNIAALSALLVRLGRSSSDSAPPAESLRTLDGVDFDLYSPAGKARSAVVALHGVTVNGRHDSRLVQFGRALAASGVVCAIPTLPKLSACDWSPRDIDAILEVIGALRDRGFQRCGIIGFSHGASYGLVAASRQPAHVAFVIAFGPYYSLADLYEYFASLRDVEPTSATHRDDLIYLHVVMARALRGRADLPVDLHAAVDSLLDRYCHEASAQEKIEFFERRLKHLNLLTVAAKHVDRDVLDAVSPMGKLGNIECPVSLLHDVNDWVVPHHHSRRIHEELGSSQAQHRLLVTPLLSHVRLADSLRLGDMAKLFAALEPVVDAAG